MYLKITLFISFFLLATYANSNDKQQEESKTATATVTATVLSPISIDFKHLEENKKNNQNLQLTISKESNRTIINFE